jgi:predicted NBD/HSP70 family sugar kinase
VNVLVIDIGGTNVKFLATGHDTPRKFPSGRELTPEKMVADVLAATGDWEYDAVSVGYPGPVLCGQPMTEPVNLGPGWMGFDLAAAFGKPVKMINDAAMQALGSYQGGKMLFLGFGTGVGAAVVHEGVVEPGEVGRFHYRKRTLEHYCGKAALKRLGRKKWQRHVGVIVAKFIEVLKPTDVVLGGGNARKLDPLPPGTRLGSNALAFVGGARLWEPEYGGEPPAPTADGKPVNRRRPPSPRRVEKQQ